MLGTDVIITATCNQSVHIFGTLPGFIIIIGNSVIHSNGSLLSDSCLHFLISSIPYNSLIHQVASAFMIAKFKCSSVRC